MKKHRQGPMPVTYKGPTFELQLSCNSTQYSRFDTRMSSKRRTRSVTETETEVCTIGSRAMLCIGCTSTAQPAFPGRQNTRTFRPWHGWSQGRRRRPVGLTALTSSQSMIRASGNRKEPEGKLCLQSVTGIAQVAFLITSYGCVKHSSICRR